MENLKNKRFSLQKRVTFWNEEFGNAEIGVKHGSGKRNEAHKQENYVVFSANLDQRKIPKLRFATDVNSLRSKAVIQISSWLANQHISNGRIVYGILLQTTC